MKYDAAKKVEKISAVKVLVLMALGGLVPGSETLSKEANLRQVRRLEMHKLGISNPAGLTFSPLADGFLVAPSRNNGGLVMVTFARDLMDINAAAIAITDPLNLAFDGKSNCLLFFDSHAQELVEIKAAEDGLPRSSLEAITRFNAASLGVKQARGMTVDPETGTLFFLVASAPPAVPAIVRVIADSRERFLRPIISRISLDALQGTQPQGIAFNPNDGHLYTISRPEQKLYEITPAGEVISTRDFSTFGLANPQNMVFAPSGDQTDDPAILNLYIANSGLGSRRGYGDVIEFSLTRPQVLDLSSITVDPSLVQTIHTSEWSPPSPDPGGATYLPTSNTLLITDSEVDEIPALFAGVNVFEISLTGEQIREFSTLAFSDEPAEVAYNPRNGHLFFADDTGPKSVYEMDAGPDRLFGTSDDVITSFRTGDFSSNDPEGITYNNFSGHLFIVDGDNAEVYEVSPGANGLFDGVPPNGDDIVSQFDTSVLGLQDPEGLEFNADNGNLYIVSRAAGDEIVVEITTTGTPVRAIDISFLEAKGPGGLAHAPSSVNPAEKNLYIVDRGIDNGVDPNENDGKIYEITIPQSPPSIVIGDVVIEEGDSGTANAIFTMSLSSISELTVTVDYATRDASATAGSDYIPVSGQAIFQPGELSQPVTVVVNGDIIDEPDETFFVKLSNAANAIIGDGEGVGTIMNDDAPNRVTISFQDGLSGYKGTRDTVLKSDTPNSNYANVTTLEVDGAPDESSLLYWDLAGIAPGNVIRSANITVDVSNTSGGATYEIYQMMRPWVEEEATWNRYASGQSWQVAGADGSEDRGAIILGTLDGSHPGLNAISLNSFGVAMVQSWVDNPATNYGVIIFDYINHTNDVNFSSRETEIVANRPKLTITYDGEEFVLPPQRSRLLPNYPNPFNPTTKISYIIANPGFVTLKIHDLRGREVEVLVNKFQTAGTHTLDFDGRNLVSGTYFYTLRVGDDFVQTQKMLFLR